jgi:hypothetical protein
VGFISCVSLGSTWRPDSMCRWSNWDQPPVWPLIQSSPLTFASRDSHPANTAVVATQHEGRPRETGGEVKNDAYSELEIVGDHAYKSTSPPVSHAPPATEKN